MSISGISVGSYPDYIGMFIDSSANTTSLWNASSMPLVIASGNAERLRIPSAGIGLDNTSTSILGLVGTSLVYKNNVVDSNSSQVLSNKDIDSAVNSIKVGGTAIGSLLGQDVRASASVSFAGVAVTGNSIRINNSQTPASASSAGVTGTICWDSSYVYVCVATNTWTRVAIATW